LFIDSPIPAPCYVTCLYYALAIGFELKRRSGWRLPKHCFMSYYCLCVPARRPTPGQKESSGRDVPEYDGWKLMLPETRFRVPFYHLLSFVWLFFFWAGCSCSIGTHFKRWLGYRLFLMRTFSLEECPDDNFKLDTIVSFETFTYSDLMVVPLDTM